VTFTIISEPQKITILYLLLIARLKAFGLNINMSAKDQAELEDTPLNRLKLWFKFTTEGRTGVCIPSHPFEYSTIADLG
jgi:hypothetical protein